MHPFRLVTILMVLSLLNACKANVGKPTGTANPAGFTAPTNQVTEISRKTPSLQPTKPFSTTPSQNPRSTIPPTQKSEDETAPTRAATEIIHEVTQDEIDTLVFRLSQAWRKGENAEKLKDQLSGEGWTIPPVYDWIPAITPGETFVEVDLNGDGLREWVVSIFLQPGSCFPGKAKEYGELWVIGESGLIFRVYQISKWQTWGAPVIISIQDMTGDGLPEIVTRAIYCDIHTVLGGYHILGFRHGKVDSIVELENELEIKTNFVRAFYEPFPYSWSPGEIGIPTPSDKIIDMTNDGLTDLVLRGGKYGSVGAGDVRERTEVWSWDGSNISLTELSWEKTNQRFHLLYNANAAFALQDGALAETLYKRVILDDKLLNGVGYGTPEENLAAAQKFSAFRLLLLYLRREDKQNAEKWNQWLQINYGDSLIS